MGDTHSNTFQDKDAELAYLRRSEEHMRRLSENLADGMVYQIDTGIAGEIREFTYISSSVERFHGITVEEALQNAVLVYQSLVPEDLEKLIIIEADAVEKGITFKAEARVNAPDGTVKWSQYISEPHRDERGHLVFDGIELDITDRKLAEIKAEESEQRLLKEKERLAEAQRLAHIGNWELNLVTDSLHWSEEIFRIFEIAPQKFGASYEFFLSTVHPEDRENVNLTYLNSIENKTPYEITHRLLMDDGRVKYVHERCKTTFDEDGKPLISVGTVQDITEIRTAEIESSRLQKELYQSQRIEAIGKLAGGIAHDFNNMLGVILGRTEELLESSTVSGDVKESIQEIKSAADRSANLTRQLLAFSRQEAIAPRQLNLNSTIEGMMKMLSRLIGENIQINWKPTSKETPVHMDPGQIDQILANLCVNARDSIATIGKIVITTEITELNTAFCQSHPGVRPGEYVLLSVKDSGKGMEREVLERIFEPFFTTKEVGQGTGLGLSTIYGIVQQNGGFIEVESTPGAGTTFFIYIPVNRSEKKHNADEDTVVISINGGETILLVEDEEMLLRTLERVLIRYGYKVISTHSPEEALDYCDSSDISIDLLITDVIMPGVNGRKLAEALQKQYDDLKVLFMSGYTSSVISDHGILDSGINFIQKPFQFEDLLVKIRKIIDS